MTYALQQLLAVRNHRERKAQHRVARNQALLVQAQAEKERRTAELAAFRRWRLEEEQRLLTTLTSQKASVQDLLCFHGRISCLRADQTARGQLVDAAAQQVTGREEALQTARRVHAEAFRQREKIKAHRER
jgi:type III secretion protein O